MNLATANELVRQGNLAAARDMYESLARKNPLPVYRQALDYIALRLGHQAGPRRILFVTAGLKGPTPGGGIATCFHSMAQTLGTQTAHEVSILYMAHPYYSRESYEYWKQYYAQQCNANLLVTSVNKLNYGSVEMQRSEAALEFLRKHEDAYDTVVFHDFGGLAYFTLLAKSVGGELQKVQVVISAHGNHSLSYNFGSKKISAWSERAAIYMERESIRRADAVTVPSDYYKDWLCENVAQRDYVVLPNIILEQTPGNDPLSVRFRDRSRQLVVFYGRLERLKGLDVLIDALQLANLQGTALNVLFAGNSTKIDGVEARQYVGEQLAGAPHQVEFAFNCESGSLYRFVRDHDGVCVYPTQGETSSCVVVESCLAGIRFIASDIDPIRELIAPEFHSSVLARTGDHEDLLKKVLAPPPRATGALLRRSVKENMDAWIAFFGAERAQAAAGSVTPRAAWQPLVSIVVPTCNRPVLLDQALASLKKQTYRRIEIVVVDDGSVDLAATQEVCSRHGVRLMALREKLYKGAACNHAVGSCSGEIVCFFDDDDIAREDMIASYVDAFGNTDADVLSGFAEVFEHESFVRQKAVVPEYKSLALGGGLEVNLHINLFGKGTFCVRREAFDRVGGYETDADSVPMVDYRFYLKAAAHGLRIEILPRVQYSYRKNSPDSLFYANKNKRSLQFKAKKSIERILVERVGRDLGSGLSATVWELSLPKFA